jgi:hypothetical protein
MGKLSIKNARLLEALCREGQISTSLANPPVFGLVRAGLARFKYRSEGLNIIEITDLGRAALNEPAPSREPRSEPEPDTLPTEGEGR